MSERLRRVVAGSVRGWTRFYTWRMPPALRDRRRAEVDADLWDCQRDNPLSASPLDLCLRLLIGIPDDIGWRVDHAAAGGTLTERGIAIGARIAGAALFVSALWVIDADASRRPPAGGAIRRPVVPIYALVVSRPDGQLGRNLIRAWTIGCDRVLTLAADVDRHPTAAPSRAPTPGGRAAPPCGEIAGPGSLAADRRSAPELAEIFSRYVDRVVVDRTGLAGRFNVVLTWTPDPASAVPATHEERGYAGARGEAGSIFEAVKEQLGLELQPATGLVEVPPIGGRRVTTD